MRSVGFVALIVAATASWHSPLQAQQPSEQKVLGILNSGSIPAINKKWMAAILRGAGESGYVLDKNLKIDHRAANGDYNRLTDLARELVNNNVDAIIAAGGPISAIKAKEVTDKVPIIFTTIADPVKSGLVASLNRPGGNVTGTAGLTTELDAKRLERLGELTPAKGKIGVLVNANRPDVEAQSRALEDAAHSIPGDREITMHKVRNEKEFDAAFDALAKERIDGLLVTADPLFNFHRKKVVALAAQHRFPAIYQWREFVEDGGLMSYGPDIEDAYHQAGVYAGRILKGTSPADLPVMQPTRFYLIINAKTAKSLGLTLPANLVAIVDEIIDN
jgi:putative ABC transport system substrate-binding protein